jgi:hypothetical protein
MKKWAMPLGIFVSGQLVLLVLFIFMPSVDAAVNTTATATSAITPTFWGWGWVMTNGVVRMLLYAFGELAVCALSFVALMKSPT